MRKTARKSDAASPRRSVEPPPKERFEVLLEEIRDNVNASLEGHSVLKAELEQFREEMNERFIETDVKFDALNVKIDGVRTELKEEIQGVRTELKEEIQGVRTELKEEIKGVRTELKEEIRSTGAQLSDKIDDVARNLAEHRADTEVHRSQYRVSE